MQVEAARRNDNRLAFASFVWSEIGLRIADMTRIEFRELASQHGAYFTRRGEMNRQAGLGKCSGESPCARPLPTLPHGIRQDRRCLRE